MLVFISYPRDLAKSAEKLEVDLLNLEIEPFLDSKHIPYSNPWKVEIENNIEKADIFVVLYLAVDKVRYFLTEIESIERKCRSSGSVKLITVIFLPTRHEDLPPFFSSRNCIPGSTNENESHQWIDKFLLVVKKSKESIAKKRNGKTEYLSYY